MCSMIISFVFSVSFLFGAVIRADSPLLKAIAPRLARSRHLNLRLLLRRRYEVNPHLSGSFMGRS